MEQYNVTGMSCAACSARVEKAVSKVPGVTSCSVSLLTNSMGVEGTAAPADIVAAVEAAGYGASPKNAAAQSAAPSADALKDTETPRLKRRLIASLIFWVVLMYFSMGHMLWNWPLPGFMQGRCEAGNGYFSASSDSQWQEQSESSNNMLALLGGGVAGISLLVGGIGIMNIMLVSVTERTREIGIRMAIGARKRDIIGQFLVEASVVSCCGGVIGIVLGCFLSAVLGNLLLAKTQNSYMPTVEQFTVLPSAGLVIGAFLFSALLGIIFGLYPANKASNLQPVDALRTQ